MRCGIDIGRGIDFRLVLLAVNADVADDRRAGLPDRHAAKVGYLQRFGGDVDQRLKVVAVTAFIRRTGERQLIGGDIRVNGQRAIGVAGVINKQRLAGVTVEIVALRQLIVDRIGKLRRHAVDGVGQRCQDVVLIIKQCA